MRNFDETYKDACALAALTAYIKAAEENMCTEEFIRDLKENILPD